MIDFTVETGKFRSLLSTAFMYKTDVVMDNIRSFFDPAGLLIRDIVPPGIAAINIIAPAKFFKSYDGPDTQTEVNLTQSLFHTISKKFKQDEVIDVTISDTSVVIKGKTESYVEDLLKINKDPFPLQLKTTREYGVIPANAEDTSKIIALVPIQEFSALEDSKVHSYTVLCRNSKLTAISKTTGTYSIDITVKDGKKLEDIDLHLNANYFDRMVSNLANDVWLFSDGNAISLSQVRDDMAVLLMVSAEDESAA